MEFHREIHWNLLQKDSSLLIYIYQLGGYQTNPGGTKILTERKETTREWETGDLHPFALAVYKSEKEAGETMAESIGSQSLCCYLKLQWQVVQVVKKWETSFLRCYWGCIAHINKWQTISMQ